jgi:hypothetical protein
LIVFRDRLLFIVERLMHSARHKEWNKAMLCRILDAICKIEDELDTLRQLVKEELEQ